MWNILIADDDRHIRRLLAAVLEAEKYTVFEAEDGNAALKIIDKEHIDLAIVDVMMPHMDGYALTEALRKGDENLPILMASAKHLPKDKHRGFLVGCDDYITKPIDEEEMLLRIKALLRRAKSQASER